jgi:hypothetical protein
MVHHFSRLEEASEIAVGSLDALENSMIAVGWEVAMGATSIVGVSHGLKK